MALQSSSLFAWVPNVEMKKDPKQMTFDIPHCLMPLTRQIFYRRYGCDVAGTAGYQVDRLDEGTNPTRTIHVEDSNDISIVSTDLPSQDLLRTKIQVKCDTVKLVTITILYSTGTVLVQGNRCPRWRDEEFSSLIKCIRAIYAFVDRVKEPELHETVTTNLRNSTCRLFHHRRQGSPDYTMLDLGAARVHSCQGQPGVREGARVDFRPSVPSQPHLQQLQSRFPSISSRPATWIIPVPHLLPHPASPPHPASQPTQSHLHHTTPP